MGVLSICTIMGMIEMKDLSNNLVCRGWYEGCYFRWFFTNIPITCTWFIRFKIISRWHKPDFNA